MASPGCPGIIGSAVKTGPHDSEIIQGNVGKLKPPGCISHGPDIRSRRPISIIYFHTAAGRNFDTGRLQIQSRRVGSSACSDQNCIRLQITLFSIGRIMNVRPVPFFSDAGNGRANHELNALFFQNLLDLRYLHPPSESGGLRSE